MWEGPDHFLFIETQAFVARVSESYRRIDFRNVQAVSITRTQHRIWYNVVGVLLLALGVWSSVTAQTDNSPGLHVFGLLFGVPGLIVILANLLKGPTVRAKILTAVQVLTVKGIKRQKAAQKLATRAAELCMIHQGGLPRTTSETNSFSHVGSVPLQGVKVKLPFAGSRSVIAAALAMIASGVLLILDGVTPLPAVTLLNCLAIMLAGMLCIAGLGRNRDRAMPPAILGSLWTGVFMTVAVGIGLYILLNITHIRTLAEDGNGARVFSGFDMQSFSEMAKVGFPEWPGVAIAMIVSGIVLSLCGLIALPAAITAKRLFQGRAPV